MSVRAFHFHPGVDATFASLWTAKKEKKEERKYLLFKQKVWGNIFPKLLFKGNTVPCCFTLIFIETIEAHIEQQYVPASEFVSQ